MFEAFAIIAMAIFTGLMLWTVTSVAILMNRKFIGWYLGRIMAASEDVMKNIREAQETEIERERFVELV